MPKKGRGGRGKGGPPGSSGESSRSQGGPSGGRDQSQRQARDQEGPPYSQPAPVPTRPTPEAYPSLPAAQPSHGQSAPRVSALPGILGPPQAPQGSLLSAPPGYGPPRPGIQPSGVAGIQPPAGPRAHLQQGGPGAPGASGLAGPSDAGGASTSGQTLAGEGGEMALIQRARPASGVSSSHVGAPRRPGFGQAGRPVKLLANHFKVTIQHMETMTIYHYDVTIKGTESSRAVPRAISRPILRQVLAENQPDFGGTLQRPARPAYDGSKSLYSPKQLPFSEQEFQTVLSEEGPPAGGAGAEGGPPARERRFRVTIKQAGVYSMEALVRYLRGQQRDMPQEIIQALDVALRERPVQLFIPVGRSFFHESFNPTVTYLDGGLLSWRGFFQSLRPTQQGLALNVDAATTAFYEPINLADYIGRLLRKDFDTRTILTDAERLKVRRAISRLKVTVTHRDTPRRYRITGLTRETTRDLHFSLGENTQMTSIVDYFRDTYRYNIELLGLPCVTVGGSSGASLPMECCRIVPGQKYGGKLDDRQTTNMLRSACKRPQERLRDVMDMVNRNDFQRDEHAREFGMQINLQMTSLQGRVLDPPSLKYEGTGQVRADDLRKGSWNLLAGQKLAKAGRILHWGLVSFAPSLRDNDLLRIRAELVKRCAELGLWMNERTVLDPKSFPESQIESILRRLCERASSTIQPPQKLQLIVIVLPRKGTFYGLIKRLCDTIELGVPTQCCLADKIRDCKSQYLANLALKINVKVGGQNVEFPGPMPGLPDLAARQEPTIIFGADVNHPTPGDDTAPSIAALVANMDVPMSFKYRCLLSTQPHRQESIEGLHRLPGDPAGEGMFRKLLVEFYATSVLKRKPSRIIYFRDGVSEGQFNQVLYAELRAMQMACVSLDANYRPKFTVVVVQKRHHTRCFAADGNKDRNGNVLPGTVVDSVICHPQEFDFYMYSHAGLQGTTRPTHYHVLWDDNNFTADGLQNLVHSLSYTYARCTRSVSLVPPVYYADLAAARARLHLEGAGSASGSDRGGERGGTGTGSGSSGSSSRQGPPPVPQLPPLADICRNGMFFC